MKTEQMRLLGQIGTASHSQSLLFMRDLSTSLFIGRTTQQDTSNPVKKKFFTVTVVGPWRPREVVDDPSVEVFKSGLCWAFEQPGLVKGAPAKGSRVGTR